MATPKPRFDFLAKLGAIFFFLWGILHFWVPYGGFTEYYKSGNGINMIVGGDAVSKSEFKAPTDEKTMFALNMLFLNFVCDVGGYGVVALFVAYLVWNGGDNAWLGYFMGLFCLGVADLAFLRYLVMSGVIEQTFPVLMGPLLWFIAIAVTPFGLV